MDAAPVEAEDAPGLPPLASLPTTRLPPAEAFAAVPRNRTVPLRGSVTWALLTAVAAVMAAGVSVGLALADRPSTTATVAVAVLTMALVWRLLLLSLSGRR
ncbi:MAG TPA: hypothetical protein VF244_03900 [Acidimicrobiales bacterium]